MTGKRAYLIVAAIAVLALIAGACSSGSDVVADNVAEQLIEAGVEGDRAILGDQGQGLCPVRRGAQTS